MSDFSFFTELDAVMGGTASVAPVHSLDSSAGNSSTIITGASDKGEEEELADIPSPTSSLP